MWHILVRKVGMKGVDWCMPRWRVRSGGGAAAIVEI